MVITEGATNSTRCLNLEFLSFEVSVSLNWSFEPQIGGNATVLTTIMLYMSYLHLGRLCTHVLHVLPPFGTSMYKGTLSPAQLK